MMILTFSCCVRYNKVFIVISLYEKTLPVHSRNTNTEIWVDTRKKWGKILKGQSQIVKKTDEVMTNKGRKTN